jgi:hypothetical protein
VDVGIAEHVHQFIGSLVIGPGKKAVTMQGMRSNPDAKTPVLHGLASTAEGLGFHRSSRGNHTDQVAGAEPRGFAEKHTSLFIPPMK